MSFRNNMPAQDRGFYFDPSTADDTLSGQTIENPKKTIQAAIDAAAALSPVPSQANIAIVSAAQGGSITGSLVLQDGILFDGDGISLTSDAVVACKLASSLVCKLTTVTNSLTNGVCFEIDGESSLGVESDFMGVAGTDGIGVKISNSCDQLFLTNSLITVTGLRGIALDVTGTSPTPIDGNANTIILAADDSKFIRYDPDNATDVLSTNVSSVVSPPGTTGEIAFEGFGGTLLAENAGTIDVETICHVHSGHTLVLNATSLKGAIIVDSGGLLIVNCLDADVTGADTVDGTINGRLGEQLFGTWATQQLAEFDANDATFPSSDPATANSRNSHPILAFDASTEEQIIFHGVMPLNYSGGDINVGIDWVAATATSGAVVWGVEVEAMPAGFNIDSDSFDTRQTGTTTAPGTSGDIATTTITLTNAEADEIVAGSAFRLKLVRVAADGSDTMTGDAQALRVVVEQ